MCINAIFNRKIIIHCTHIILYFIVFIILYNLLRVLIRFLLFLKSRTMISCVYDIHYHNVRFKCGKLFYDPWTLTAIRCLAIYTKALFSPYFVLVNSVRNVFCRNTPLTESTAGGGGHLIKSTYTHQAIKFMAKGGHH